MNRVSGHNGDDALWEDAARAFDDELREMLLGGHITYTHLVRIVERLWAEDGTEGVIQVIADELGLETPRERVESMKADAETAITEVMEP